MPVAASGCLSGGVTGAASGRAPKLLARMHAASQVRAYESTRGRPQPGRLTPGQQLPGIWTWRRHGRIGASDGPRYAGVPQPPGTDRARRQAATVRPRPAAGSAVRSCGSTRTRPQSS
jgi:hypothetical protein